MKNISFITKILLSLSFVGIFLISCTNENDNRIFEGVKIVGVKLNGELYIPEYSNDTTIVNIPAGKDISNVKVDLLIANGKAINFKNGLQQDCRKTIMVELQGFNGDHIIQNLKIVSPPKLAILVIEGLQISKNNIYESSNSVIVQVPQETDLTNLKVTIEFNNGTLMNFENGKPLNYTNPQKFVVLGEDGETKYSYDLIITTEKIGPASVKEIIINNIKSDSVIVVGNNKLIAYIPSLTDLSSVNIDLVVGYGNKIDPEFKKTGLNLFNDGNKVKITGTNGIVTEFTLGVPQLSLKPLFYKDYSQLSSIGFAPNDLSSIGFSGNYLLAANYTAGNKVPVYFDFNGDKVSSIDATGVNPTGYGFRKFATDDKGAILAMSLGMSSGEQWIYKWNSVTDRGSEYISFSKTSLGVDYSPRAAGISISGSLDGNAIITLPIAQKTDVFVWTVSNGTLNPTPQKVTYPYATSYYWSVQPAPITEEGFVGFSTSASFNGIVKLGKQFGEIFNMDGLPVTDGKIIKYHQRTYLAYTLQKSNDAFMRIFDITDGTSKSFSTPLFDKKMSLSGSNANVTLDADFTIINDKLYVAFSATNIGLYLYCLNN